MAKAPTRIAVETLTHDDATRKNIPTAEHQSLMHDADKSPVRIAYERRNRDLDPQLVGVARMSRIGPIWWCLFLIAVILMRFPFL